MDRKEIADLITQRLRTEFSAAHEGFASSDPEIGYFVVDDLLPTELAHRIFSCFPSGKDMRLKKSLREYKYIAAQMDMYDPILEEAIYAFQDPRVVELVSGITGIDRLEPDENLYAGGISLMGNKHFLNPHLDNSHDKDRNRWRVLNLLYYVTPEWALENGGNLELWPDGPTGKQLVVESRFNRLAVMATHRSSWHSVSRVRTDKNPRCCVSNYYFREQSLRPNESFHVTSFRGRPEQPVRDLVLRADIALRSTIRKVFKKGIVENPHVYKK